MTKVPASPQQHRIDLELEIYNEMSYNFLQINHKEESRIFAEKYESGYTEPDQSKIRKLSKELITSVHSRVKGWHSVSPKTFELLFFTDFSQLVESNRQRLRTFDQETILDCFHATFDSVF